MAPNAKRNGWVSQAMIAAEQPIGEQRDGSAISPPDLGQPPPTTTSDVFSGDIPLASVAAETAGASPPWGIPWFTAGSVRQPLGARGSGNSGRLLTAPRFHTTPVNSGGPIMTLPPDSALFSRWL